MHDKTLNSELWEEKQNTSLKTIKSSLVENDKCVTIGETSRKSENKISKDITLKKGQIYLITNNVTNGKYIGQTINSLKSRLSDHKRNAFKLKYRCPLYCAIRKYGIENFSIINVETLCEDDEFVLADKLNEREVYFIKVYNTFVSDNTEFGYNATTGGGNCRFSEESKQKISEGQKRWWSDERKKKQSVRSLSLWRTEEYRKTHKEAMKKSVTDDFRKKVSKKSIEMWSSTEFKDKMSKVRKNLYLNNKNIRDNLTRNGKRNGRYDYTVYTFKNQKTDLIYQGTQFEFTQYFNLKRVMVNGLVRGRSKQYRGWVIING